MTHSLLVVTCRTTYSLISGSAEFVDYKLKCRSHAQNGSWKYHAVRGNWRSTTGTYHYEIGEKDASVFFALSLEKAIFVPGIVEHANFRTAEFLRDGAEIESWTRVIETVMRGKLI